MSLKGTVWAPLGPSPIKEGSGEDNGLVTTIAVNPNNTEVLYLGTAQGGVWRSTDGGHHWAPLFDQQPSLGIGERAGIAIDPNDTDVVYVGTSARMGSREPDIIRQPSAGLFKSTDGGASWLAVGSGYPAGNTGNASQFTGQWINAIAVDPADSRIVYLASSSGLYVSSDGGQNWVAARGVSGDTRSLQLDLSTPAKSRILYVGVDGTGVYKSVDGGTNFTQILGSTTAAVATALGTNSFVRVVVALAPPTAPPDVNGIQVLYTALSGTYNGPDPIGLFISTDQGASWTKQAATGVSGTSYGGYALDIAVDPASPGDGNHDTIFFGCLRQFKSTDAGASFTSINVGHADTHTWTVVPRPAAAHSIVYCGTDGGIDVSTDGGASFQPRNGGGLQTGLFYNIAIKPDATASVTAGALQDNQIQTTAGGVTAPEWLGTFGGDGWDVAWDGASPPVLYSTSGGPATTVAASTDDGATFPTTLTPPWTSADTGGFLLTPLAADPSASGILYASGNQNLWQRQSGGSWRKILTPGSSGNVDVAPGNGNHVVIAVGSQVFLSTNALASTVGPPTGVLFTNITANLPSRNIARVVFDPLDPNILYAVLTGFSGGAPANVFRTTVGAAAWTNISPAVNVPCGAIAVDATTTPSTLYVGTDLGVLRSTDLGTSWSVLDDLRFPRVPVFDLAFNPRAGMLRAGTYGRGVFEFTTPKGPAIAVELEDGLAFGTVCAGPHHLTLTVANVGRADLIISNVERLVGSSHITVLPTPATPLTLAPGEDLDFTVVFNPGTPGGPETATIRVTSNDPAAPTVDVTVTGARGAGRLVTALADNGAFGDVCLGLFADQTLTINNAGTCPLYITAITGSAQFLAPRVAAYPLEVGAGGAVDVSIRFQPNAYGAQTGTITIFSDDAAGPATVPVSGECPPPRVTLIIADSGDFGQACIGAFVDEPLTITNSGNCTLSVDGIVSNSSEFVVPAPTPYPVMIGPGEALPAPIRFAPTSFGHKTATITVSSNDPASPISVNVSGDAPPGKLAVTGSTIFGGVSARCFADRTVTLTNVGDCALHVTKVRLPRKSRHQWRLLHNPFPAKLHAGSSLSVVVQYHATEKCARVTELIIESDDPVTPEKRLDLVAYTIWETRCAGEDGDDCDRCARHVQPCRQGYSDCCDEDHDDHDRDG